MYQRLYQKHVAVDEEMNLQALLLPVKTSKPNKKKHINCNILILSKVVKLDWYYGTSKRILVQDNIINKLHDLKIWGHNLMVDINLFQISKKRKFVLHCIAHSFT